jgi:hypothetical protein
MITAAQAHRMAHKAIAQGAIFDVIRQAAGAGSTTLTVATGDYAIDTVAPTAAGFVSTVSADMLSITINW